MCTYMLNMFLYICTKIKMTLIFSAGRTIEGSAPGERSEEGGAAVAARSRADERETGGNATTGTVAGTATAGATGGATEEATETATGRGGGRTEAGIGTGTTATAGTTLTRTVNPPRRSWRNTNGG